MGSSSTPNITIISVAVSDYREMEPLPGTLNDVHRLKELLVESDKTALFKSDQFFEIIDPTAEDLRGVINRYVIDTSNKNEILIFYFSGHGVPIGRNDFGFCTIDTKFHPDSNAVLPLSIIKFSDIMQTLYPSNITPVIIIDACYSGIAGHSLEIPPLDMITLMRDEMHSQYGIKYALLTSCADYQTTTTSSFGSLFSHYLVEVATNLIESETSNKMFLSLQDIYPELESKVMAYSSGEITPRLFLGESLPEFNLVKNVSYSPRRESLAPYLIRVMRAFWNEGIERELSPGEISDLCGKGAYGNHNKLSLNPWSLVEDNPITKKRKLTKRGKKFLLGELDLPKRIELDQDAQDFVPAPNTEYVNISDYPTP